MTFDVVFFNIFNNKMISSKRIEWIDAIKAICIFAVVMNHSLMPHDWFRVDFFFLVGFFFCSGYVFNRDYSVIKRITKIIDTIILPYLLLTTVTFFISKSNVEGLINDPVFVFTEFSVNLLLGIKYWFLPCLVSMELLYTIVSKLKIPNLDYILLCICSLIYLVGLINDSRLPWHLDTAIYGMVFFSFGHQMRKWNIDSAPILSLRGGLLLASLYIITGNFLFPLFPFNTSLNYFTNNWIVLIMNFWGIIVLMQVSMHIKRNWFVDFLGKNSLTIYVIHISLLGPVHRLFSWTHETIWENSFMGILCSFIIVIVLYPVCVILKKWFSWSCGGSKFFQHTFLH